MNVMMKPSHKETTEVTLNGGDVGQVILRGVRSLDGILIITGGGILNGLGIGQLVRGNPIGGRQSGIGSIPVRFLTGVTKVALIMRTQLGHLGTPDVD